MNGFCRYSGRLSGLHCKNVRFSDLCFDVFACASYIKKSEENTGLSAEQFEEVSQADENSDEIFS